MTTTENTVHPSFGEAFKVWLKIGCINFGGPAGQIAMMHRILVDEKKWIDEARFLHALNFSMLLPGPEATRLATYVGWLLHGVRGGLGAGILFVLPGAFVLLGLAIKAPDVTDYSGSRWRQFTIATIIGLAIWWAPVALAALTLGPHHILVGVGIFFSKLAVVTFGGAYAVLAYMAQQVVETNGWLTAPEMVDALGLAETTPGPLILVTQFVGFLAAFREAC